MPPRITSGEIKWCRRENRPSALNEKAVRCTCPVSFSCPRYSHRRAKRTSVPGGRIMLGPCISQNGRKSVTKLEWEKKREKGGTTNSQALPGVGFFIRPIRVHPRVRSATESVRRTRMRGRTRKRRTVSSQ